MDKRPLYACDDLPLVLAFTMNTCAYDMCTCNRSIFNSAAFGPAQILKAGKTIHFLRECCGDPHWADLVASAAGRFAAGARDRAVTTYRDMAWLEEVVSAVDGALSRHLLDIVFNKYRCPLGLLCLQVTGRPCLSCKAGVGFVKR